MPNNFAPSQMRKCNFPWLFSNVVDTTAASASESAQKYTEEPQEGDAQVGGTLKHWVTNVGGVRVGCVGLVEK